MSLRYDRFCEIMNEGLDPKQTYDALQKADSDPMSDEELDRVIETAWIKGGFRAIRNAVKPFTRRQVSCEEMSAKEIENAIYTKALAIGVDKFSTPGKSEFGDWWRTYLLPAIQPLTRQQGFVPDWSKAPKWAIAVCIAWQGVGEKESKTMTNQRVEYIQVIPRPQPTPFTDKELTARLVNRGILTSYAPLSRGTLEELAKAYGVEVMR